MPLHLLLLENLAILDNLYSWHLKQKPKYVFLIATKLGKLRVREVFDGPRNFATLLDN